MRLVFHIFGALAGARTCRRTVSRKHQLTTADAGKATSSLLDPNITKTAAARHFGVTRATLNPAFERAGIQDHGPPAPSPSRAKRHSEPMTSEEL